uniref:DNA endonuclease activator Ctp1 C-terminal domain-containing protein n=1 Tax=Panagrolaimus davidi TaxID=227884 RepID=A0A914P818_9BILA
MDIFPSSDTEDNTDVRKPNDSNLSKDFDISDDEVVDEDSDIEIIIPKKKSRKESKKENIIDESDSIETISPVKKESKPFFIPPNPNKPKQDLSPYLKKPTLSKDKKIRIATPVKKKSVKEEEKKTAKKNITKALLGTHAVNTDAKPKSGQTKIDSHFKKKDVIAERSATPPPLRPSVTSQEHRTPSPPQRRPGRSASPKFSPLPADIAEKLKAALESPGFQARKHTALTTVLERAKQQAALKPRCKFSRALMNGYECDCCKDHYDAMGLEGEERREYVNRVSKHRGFEQPPATPPHYWEIDIPSREEQIKRGYVTETDSPLFKKKK